METPAKGTKLNTYEGVFIPTTLNVLSILIYLRFGFIVGQAGIAGTLLLLLASYVINLLTTLSVSAIATNGVVKGGGAYFMISRSLGPEFGGSIGVVFFIGQVLNAGLNVAGFADPLLAQFGVSEGSRFRILPDTRGYVYLYETLLLWACTAICLTGPSLFARSSKLLFMILLAATLAVPVSVLIVPRFFDDEFDAWYTGPSLRTIRANLMPSFTKGAAGSDLDGPENFRNLFGIFFSATAGILAGSSMSSDLATPSKSIPRGTLWGLAVTFALYMSVILAVGSSASRDLLYRDVDVISTINISPFVVMLGEFATSIFSALMGVFGAAKLLQAIARDDVVPGLHQFGGGTGADDIPVKAVLLTYVLTQATILLDVNQIAVYITMALLMTFVVLNLACFLLDISSAPNFRPSFRYFNARTAFFGTISCVGAMLIADVVAALVIFLVGLAIFVAIHAYSSPKPWGDVSQSIIYHQVRKYLLKLKQDHVKYWRPQILLFVDDARSGWQLIRFCNYLKKGGLFILGHVVVVNEDFQSHWEEIAAQRSAWEKVRDMHHIKAFFQISASPSVVWGARNVFLGSGLGGMRPNISVIGFYDENHAGQQREFVDVETLPTDACRHESHLDIQEWVQVIEDLLTMGSNVAIAKGFMDIDMPAPRPLFRWWSHNSGSGLHADNAHEEQIIDLYPIQMSAQLMDSEGRVNGMSINFDTYTLILQLGSILHSVKAWTKTHRLRVVAFVEHSDEISRETQRITELLDTLRIQAAVLVCSLDSNNSAYDIILQGAPDKDGSIGRELSGSRWWQRLCEARRGAKAMPKMRQLLKSHNTNQRAKYIVPDGDFSVKKRRTLSSLQQMGVSHSIQATRWRHRDIDPFYSDSDDDDTVTASPNKRNADPTSYSPTTSSSNPAHGRSIPQSFGGPESARSSSTPTESDHTDPGPNFQDDPMDASELLDPPSDRAHSDSPMPGAVNYHTGLRFNELPAKAQHMILNCLIRRVSSKSTVIFTTLPAPALGTHRQKKSARDYYHLLALLCEGLPPVVLVHAQSMTVTTAL